MTAYTYDSEADALQVQLLDESDISISRTVELGPTLHVDLDAGGSVVGVEFLYPRTHGMDVAMIQERYGIDLRVPFNFSV